MLEQFTWGQFLLASFVLSFLWYVFVLLVFFRPEVSGFFGLGSDASFDAPLPHRWEKGVEALSGEGLVEDLGVTEVMGKSRPAEGVSVLGMGELSFAGSADGRYEQVGFVADVIQELKGIFARLEAEAGSKLDFFRHLEKVKADYGKIGAHPNVGAINGFIATHVPFHLTAEELENMWY